MAHPYPAACPSCGATVRSDVAWCTLCYASLLPGRPEPVVAPDVGLPPAVEPVGESDAPVGESDLPPDVVVDRLLAELAASREPAPGWASRLPRGRAGKALVMIGGGAVVSLLLFALMALIGLFL